MISTWNHEVSEIDSHNEQTFTQQELCTLKFCKYEVLTIKNLMYSLLADDSITWNRTHNLSMRRQLVLPLWKRCIVLSNRVGNFVIYRETDYRSNLAKTILFENCSLFFENTFQYLGGISQDISGSHFDSRRSLSSANRRQIVGDLPGRFFLSALLSLVISMTGRSKRSARALREGADVVREAIGN